MYGWFGVIEYKIWDIKKINVQREPKLSYQTRFVSYSSVLALLWVGGGRHYPINCNV